MADVKDPQKLVDDIAKQENQEDRDLIMAPLRKLRDFVVGKPEEKKEEKPKKMAKGGYVRSADGIAQRGKTRGKLL